MKTVIIVLSFVLAAISSKAEFSSQHSINIYEKMDETGELFLGVEGILEDTKGTLFDSNQTVIGLEFYGFPEETRAREVVRLFHVRGELSIEDTKDGKTFPRLDLTVKAIERTKYYMDGSVDSLGYGVLQLHRDVRLGEQIGFRVYAFSGGESSTLNNSSVFFSKVTANVLGAQVFQYLRDSGTKHWRGGLDLVDAEGSIGLKGEVLANTILKFSLGLGGNLVIPAKFQGKLFSELSLTYRKKHSPYSATVFGKTGVIGHEVNMLPNTTLHDSSEKYDGETQGYGYLIVGIKGTF